MILVIGDEITDVYRHYTAMRLCPEAPVPVVQHTKTTFAEGGALNVRNNVIAMGMKCKALCPVSGSVKTRHIVDGRQFMREDLDAYDELSEQALVHALEVNKPSVIILADYGKGAITEQTLSVINNYHLCPVFADPYPGKSLMLYDRCDVVKMNRKEWEASDKARDLERTIITDGPNDVTWANHRYPVNQVTCVDPTGAGDTFIAAFTAARCHGIFIGGAIEFAIECAAQVVQKMGTVTPTPIGVERYLHGEGEF